MSDTYRLNKANKVCVSDEAYIMLKKMSIKKGIPMSKIISSLIKKEDNNHSG